MVDDLLSETNIRSRGLFRPEVVRRFVDEHRSGAEDWSMQIWQFLTLEHWMRIFLDAGAQTADGRVPSYEAATLECEALKRPAREFSEVTANGDDKVKTAKSPRR